MWPNLSRMSDEKDSPCITENKKLNMAQNVCNTCLYVGTLYGQKYWLLVLESKSIVIILFLWLFQKKQDEILNR